MAGPTYKKKGMSSSSRKLMRRSDPLTSLLLVFPLFVIYQIGVLSMPSTYNGADLITSHMLHLLHGNSGAYLAVNVVLALAFFVLVLVLRRNNSFDPRLFVPVAPRERHLRADDGLAHLLRDDRFPAHRSQAAHRLRRRAPSSASPAAKLILSLGAGVHEELVFRLIMVGGGVWLFERGLRHAPLAGGRRSPSRSRRCSSRPRTTSSAASRSASAPSPTASCAGWSSPRSSRRAASPSPSTRTRSTTSTSC